MLNITKGLIIKPQKVVVYGPEGIGKSTFASDFPDPLFIDTEGSTNLMNVKRLDMPRSWPMLLANIREIIDTPKCCKTLVIDTIDWTERICLEYILAKANKNGIEDFGYGAGYTYLTEEMGRLLNLLTEVIDSGKNVVLTAHALIRKFELPNEGGAFDRYELKLGGKTTARTAPMVKEWADIVLFANYKTITVADKTGKKFKGVGGERVMYTTHHPNWDAKNRHDLAEMLPFDYKQIAGCIPNIDDVVPEIKPAAEPEIMQAQTPEPAAEKAKSLAQQIADKQKAEKAAQQKAEKIAQAETQPTPPAAEPKTTIQHINPTLPQALIDLMLANVVTEKEIQEVIYQKGYYPVDMPITQYPEEFINGVVIGAFKQIFDIIKENRKIPFDM